jgi:hypothetical protein
LWPITSKWPKPPPASLASCKATPLWKSPWGYSPRHRIIQSAYLFPHICALLLVALICSFPIGVDGSCTSNWEDQEAQSHYHMIWSPPA